MPPNIVQIQSHPPATRYVHYRKGDKVFEPGMLIDGFYTVIKGAFKLTIDNPETGEHFEKVFGPGEHFGERVLVRSALRTGLVVALEDGVLLFIAQKDFTRFARAFPFLDNYFKDYIERTFGGRQVVRAGQHQPQIRARNAALTPLGGENWARTADGGPGNPYIRLIMAAPKANPPAAGKAVAARRPRLSDRRLGLYFPRLSRAAAADPARPTGCRSARCTAFAPCCGSCCARPANSAPPTHFAVIFDYSAKTFRNDLFDGYKANRRRAARGPDPAVPAGPRGGARLQRRLHRAGGLRGRRHHRHLCAPGGRRRGRRDHRLLRQGPDAARRQTGIPMYDTMKDKRDRRRPR